MTYEKKQAILSTMRNLVLNTPMTESPVKIADAPKVSQGFQKSRKRDYVYIAGKRGKNCPRMWEND